MISSHSNKLHFYLFIHLVRVDLLHHFQPKMYEHKKKKKLILFFLQLSMKPIGAFKPIGKWIKYPKDRANYVGSVQSPLLTVE